jgi:hypothetical protein
MHPIVFFVAVSIILTSCGAQQKKVNTSQWMSGDTLCVDGAAIVLNPSSYEAHSHLDRDVLFKESKKIMAYLENALSQDGVYIGLVKNDLIAFGGKAEPKHTVFSFEKDSAMIAVVSKKGTIIPIYDLSNKKGLMEALEGKIPTPTSPILDAQSREALSKEYQKKTESSKTIETVKEIKK